MERSLQITYLSFIFLFSTFLPAKEKWKVSAEVLENDKINNVSIQRLNKNVRFVKENKILLTDNAIQYKKDDIIYLNGNTMMINNMDTLTCDSMVYWSTIDSIYAVGNIRFVHGSERGIMGDEMEIIYTDSFLDMIRVIKNAFAYNNLNLRINHDGPYLFFQDEMTSKKMTAYFDGEYLTKLHLINMATTSYHVVDDSLLAGNNVSSGDTILIDFNRGDIKRIQIQGGALGKFIPEKNNANIDTTVYYGGEYIDYHIDKQLTFLSENAYVEYLNTRLSAGKIIANWETNIMDAFEVNNEYPTLQTKNESPMKGNRMVFDLLAKHGRILKGRTSFDDGIYHGKEVFRDDPNIFHVNQSKYTSCDLDNPHFYLGSRKMKLLPKDRVVAKPLWLHIYDIPILGLPLAVFPNRGGSRHSGWIMPSFDSYKSIGTGFRNLGYFWAPNDYMDEKILINFFDEEGIHISSYLKYKKRNGPKWFNFQFDGNMTGVLKRRLNKSNENKSNEIIDLAYKDYKEIQKLNWNHNQKFDPNQVLSITYQYTSDKKLYQDEQEVNYTNRLKQKLYNEINYSKRWQTSSFTLGFSDNHFLLIEHNPEIGRNHYRYIRGPNSSFSANTFKLFGNGNSWYNSILGNYSMSMGNSSIDYYIDKDSSGNESKIKIIKKPSLYQKSNFNAPIKNLFGWMNITPTIKLNEYWIWTYKEETASGADTNLVDKDGFKRRLTWNSALSANTKMYGLFPITIGHLNAIRHVITPTISFNYSPDFSDPYYGYFQTKSPSGKQIDYFQDYSKTPNKEKRYYSLSIKNLFQAKILNENGGYDKPNLLSSTSNISYSPLKNNAQLSELSSTINMNNISGHKLIGISMKHDFYKLNEDKFINVWNGELPRLTFISINTDLKLNLFGSKTGQIEQESIVDTTEEDKDNFYSFEQKTPNQNKNNNLWESKLTFNYSTDWFYGDKEWDFKFSLKTNNSINLSQNWSLSYSADFNLKEREMTYHSFRIYRPLHCWEFSFNYWPRGGSAGFSLQINVKNSDLQDIKLTSKDGKRGFGGF